MKDSDLQKSSIFFVIGILFFIMGFVIDQSRQISGFGINVNPYILIGLILFLIGAIIPIRKKLYGIAK